MFHTVQRHLGTRPEMKRFLSGVVLCSYKFQQVRRVLSECQVLKHFFVVKMRRVQGVTRSEADECQRVTVLGTK